MLPYSKHMMHAISRPRKKRTRPRRTTWRADIRSRPRGESTNVGPRHASKSGEAGIEPLLLKAKIPKPNTIQPTASACLNEKEGACAVRNNRKAPYTTLPFNTYYYVRSAESRKKGQGSYPKAVLRADKQGKVNLRE